MKSVDDLPHVVYTVWGGSKPLYVGCTHSLAQRMGQHATNNPWWLTKATWIAWTEYPGRAEARKAEATRIHKLMPRGNVHYNPGSWDLSEVVTDDLYPRALCERVYRNVLRHYLNPEQAA